MTEIAWLRCIIHYYTDLVFQYRKYGIEACDIDDFWVIIFKAIDYKWLLDTGCDLDAETECLITKFVTKHKNLISVCTNPADTACSGLSIADTTPSTAVTCDPFTINQL